MYFNLVGSFVQLKLKAQVNLIIAKQIAWLHCV